MGERTAYVTTDDGCALWTVRSGGGDGGPGSGPFAEAGHGFVLCHGGPGFWDTLGPIARMLEDFGPVVRWDQRGGGRSRWRPPYTMARFLADLDQVRRYHGFEQVTVLGHSFGAMLALRYALDPAYAGRVRRLVYVAGVGLGWAWRDEHSARARLAAEPYAERSARLNALGDRTATQERELRLLKLAVEFPDRDRALDLAATQVLELFPEDEVAAPLNAEMRAWSEAELIERCRALAVPALILDGARDLRPRWAVDSLAEALPHCTRAEFADAGHFPWLDEPAAFAARLRAFVNA
ncbi:alpha/beta fold hydrolase [Actinospica durhamensis]|uniref:Alpha/beta fold hydrolase n=1 Tax=Actinospica durhamensis TaxID=1508375 RepID=A0A941ES75_9ACTN|nr:alpha/beta fold hydrolase [Actinospica durhamensis]MBR7836106.1 alpha/beta fold hydrolase [Actinospica durhamensis]